LLLGNKLNQESTAKRTKRGKTRHLGTSSSKARPTVVGLVYGAQPGASDGLPSARPLLHMFLRPDFVFLFMLSFGDYFGLLMLFLRVLSLDLASKSPLGRNKLGRLGLFWWIWDSSL